MDLIITDPPFAIDFRAQRLNYNRKGANVLEGYREIPEAEYGTFTRLWMAEAARVLAPTGSMYVFSGWNRLRDILEGLDAAGLTTVNHLIWKYQFGVFTKKKVRDQPLPHSLRGKRPEEVHLQQARLLPRGCLDHPAGVLEGQDEDPDKTPTGDCPEDSCSFSNPGDLVLDPFLGFGDGGGRGTAGKPAFPWF